MVNEKLLLGAELEGGPMTGPDLKGMNAVAYLYPSLASGFYLKGGVGYRSLTVSDEVVEPSPYSFWGSTSSTDGPAFTLGAGYDFGLRGRLAVTPFVTVSSSSVTPSVSAAIRS